MQIKFLWVGKTRNLPLKSLVSEYLDRIRRLNPCELVEVRDVSGSSSPTAALIEAEGKRLSEHIPAVGRLVVLDDGGVQFTSPEFSRWIETEQDRGARVLTFVIGGPEGLSRKIIDRADLLLSLGKMTWTHEMCRVLLLEQVYRALCIKRNIPYHKGRDS